MLRPLSFFPAVTKFDFVAVRIPAFSVTVILMLTTFATLWFHGLRLGVDFRGGTMMEVAGRQAFDLAALRGQLNGLGVGAVELQDLGTADRLLIRIERQEGDDAAQVAATNKVKSALGIDVEFRRIESVGPKVSNELLNTGLIAAAVAIVAIAAYVAFRFEWQFGVSALIATLHDVATLFGLFAVTQIEFNLTSIAAILTIAGYSINDTVVVFDRLRENLRKYKQLSLGELINLTINETLSRTIITSGTTMLSAVALLIFGGPVIFGFALAMVWGIIIGTYSSIYVAASLLLYLPSVRQAVRAGAAPSVETSKGPAAS